MASFSFDIVSEIDVAEMNNVYLQSKKEISNRYDFRGTSADIEWLDNKSGFKLTGDSEWQIDQVLDLITKKLASRELSRKVLDLTKPRVVANLRTTWEVPFKNGLTQELAKQIASDIRAELPKVKPQIQGESIRVTSSSKDDLQKVISFLKAKDYDLSLQFTNYR